MLVVSSFQGHLFFYSVASVLLSTISHVIETNQNLQAVPI